MFLTLGLLSSLLLATYGYQNGNQAPACEIPKKFDEVRLALQWTPAICQDQNCAKSVNEFTVHGLWPSNNSGNDPEFCCSRPFSMQAIKSLEPKLNVSIISIV